MTSARKILVASPYLKYENAGGSAFPYLLADGLAQAGHAVTVLGLADQAGDQERPSYRVRWLKDPVKRSWGRYPLYEGFSPDDNFRQVCLKVLKDVGPDTVIINSLNRLGNLVEAAHELRIPTVYIACDLGGSCMNEIGLLEENDARCSGPELAKCQQCQTSLFSWPRFAVSRLMKFFLKAGTA